MFRRFSPNRSIDLSEIKEKVSVPAPVCSTKDQVPAFLRSNSERRAADHAVRIVRNSPLSPKNLDEHSFLVARAAAVSGDVGYLKKLISKNKNLLDRVDHFQRTLLIYAAISGQSDCVQWLASSEGGGVDVGAKDRDGMTAVHWTVHKGHHRTLKILLKKPTNGDPLAGDQEGATALHLAAKQPSAKCLEIILEHLTRKEQLHAVITVKDNGGRSPLHWAAAAGRLPELMKLLKDKLKVTFEEADGEGRTPLMWCVLNDSSPASSLQLITQRAPKSVRSRDVNGFTALHLAVMVDNIPAMEHFLSECKLIDLNALDSEGRTALHWTGILGRPGAAALLLKAKAECDKKDVRGVTAFHYAAEKNFVETLKTMFRHGSDDLLDVEGRTCFMWAASAGAIDVLILILSKKAVDVEQKDSQGLTALHSAARHGQDVALKFLLDRGWSTESVDNEGRTPLHAAAEHGHASTLHCLLKSGATVWQKDSNGRTALHWAALGGHAFVCQMLIKQGLSVDAVDVGGRTAVHCAAFGGFVGCLSVLLQAGAHPCIPDNQGLIALHLAASEGHLEVCKKLLDCGSLINAIYNDDDGSRLTPYDLAMANNRSEAVDSLLENGAMSFEQLTNAAATKLQAFYKGYRFRKTVEGRNAFPTRSVPSQRHPRKLSFLH